MNIYALATAGRPDLQEAYRDLLVRKMNLDRWFSVFLDEHGDEMDPSDNTTPVWREYRTKLAEYENTERLITTATYYLNHATTSLRV